MCLSFVLIVVLFPAHVAAAGGLVWGMTLLFVLTYLLARYRGVNAMSEIGKHLGVALAIIFVSRNIGQWIASHVI